MENITSLYVRHMDIYLDVDIDIQHIYTIYRIQDMQENTRMVNPIILELH